MRLMDLMNLIFVYLESFTFLVTFYTNINNYFEIVFENKLFFKKIIIDITKKKIYHNIYIKIGILCLIISKNLDLGILFFSNCLIK